MITSLGGGPILLLGNVFRLVSAGSLALEPLPPLIGPGLRLEVRPSDVELLRPGELRTLKYMVVEHDGGDFLLQSVSWRLVDPANTTVFAGDCLVNNNDIWLGKIAPTFQVTIDLTSFGIVPVSVPTTASSMLVNVDQRSIHPPESLQSTWQAATHAWSEYFYLVFTILTVAGDRAERRVPVRVVSTES